MSKISTDSDLAVSQGRTTHSLAAVTSISTWVERFAKIAAILTIRYPEKAPEFLGYMAMIVGTERNYEGDRWVVYDQQFKREPLARKDLN